MYNSDQQSIATDDVITNGIITELQKKINQLEQKVDKLESKTIYILVAISIYFLELPDITCCLITVRNSSCPKVMFSQGGLPLGLGVYTPGRQPLR